MKSLGSRMALALVVLARCAYEVVRQKKAGPTSQAPLKVNSANQAPLKVNSANQAPLKVNSANQAHLKAGPLNQKHLKKGVDVSNLSPAMLYAAEIIQAVAEGMDIAFVITSGRDGAHKPNSLHYSGNALDFRTRNLSPDVKKLFVEKVRQALGLDTPYDVILEKDHLHVEYDS